MSTIIDRPTLAALRQSNDHVGFHAKWIDGEPAESYILGKRQDALGEPYTNVKLELPSLLDFGSRILREHAVVRAYASVMVPRFHELWQTIVASLRTGDEVKLVWSANGHANTNTKAAGLNVDTCELEILRKNRRLRFHIDFTICPSNTARMFTSGENGYAPIHGPDSSAMASHGPHA